MRSKKRLTITLPPLLLKKIDQTIDKTNIRNRSHAIETLILKSLTPTIDTAVILAAKSKKRTIPALTKINHQLLIHATLEHLKTYGFRKVIILAGKNQPAIKKTVGSGKSFGLKITYVHEPKLLGTAGALKKAKNLLFQETFLVLHGDILTNLNLTDFISFHQRENTLATIAVKPRDAEVNYGKLLLQGNKITDFFAHDKSEGISIVNTGVYLVNHQVLNLINKNTVTNLETDIFPQLAKMSELSAFIFQGIWFDISTPKYYKLARQRWQQKGV